MNNYQIAITIVLISLLYGAYGQVLPIGTWNLTNNVFPVFLTAIFPFYNDRPGLFVTGQMRIIGYVHSGIYECWTAYVPKSIGRYFDPKDFKRPPSEWNTRNKNICMIYFLSSLQKTVMPISEATLRDVLNSLGLNPNFTGQNPNTPGLKKDEVAAAVGNRVAAAAVKRAISDGFNQLGDVGRTYFRQNYNYSDYTGYAPVNTAYNLVNPDRWQPNFSVDSKSRQVEQAFTTPQFAFTKTFHTVVNETQCEPLKYTYRSQLDHKDFIKKTQEVIDSVAGLTDYQKVTAEFFDNKIYGIGALARYLNGNDTYQIDSFMSTVPVVNIAMIDSMAACWYHKLKNDGVRPFSAVRLLKANQTIKGWGGPRLGTVNIKAAEWRSYIPTDSFPEHPSGTSCLCWAFAGAAKAFLGRNSFNWSFTYEPGQSVIEPGFTPQKATTFFYPTFDDMAKECGNTRVWIGVHFRQASEAARGLCEPVGKNVGLQHRRLVDGKRLPTDTFYEEFDPLNTDPKYGVQY